MTVLPQLWELNSLQVSSSNSNKNLKTEQSTYEQFVSNFYVNFLLAYLNICLDETQCVWKNVQSLWVVEAMYFYPTVLKKKTKS